ncbi:hypothetical protein PTKIN_Ptkin03bG0228900 [Pterospermum kingtungense]
MMLLFSKVLTATDVKKRMAIPTSCLKHLIRSDGGDSSMHLRVEDENEETWEFTCFSRPIGVYSKPYFCGEWIQFVKHRNICVGDRVHFYRNDAAEAYRIEVQRKIVLLGRECWSNPTPQAQRRVNFEKRREGEGEDVEESSKISSI